MMPCRTLFCCFLAGENETALENRKRGYNIRELSYLLNGIRVQFNFLLFLYDATCYIDPTDVPDRVF